jgi:hypothetical protein
VYYALGEIVGEEFLPVQLNARVAAGMEPEDAGPIRDQAVREDLKTRWLQRIRGGEQDLEKAADLDRHDEEPPMALSRLLRERADLADSPRQYDEDIQAANRWAQRALEIRRANAELRAAGQGKP